MHIKSGFSIVIGVSKCTACFSINDKQTNKQTMSLSGVTPSCYESSTHYEESPGYRTADHRFQVTALYSVHTTTRRCKYVHPPPFHPPGYKIQELSHSAQRYNNEVPPYKLSKKKKKKASTFNDEFTFSLKTTRNRVFDVCFLYLSY
jgi:hypothetical protein